MYQTLSKSLCVAGVLILMTACAGQPQVAPVPTVQAVTQPVGPDAGEMASYQAAVQYLEQGDYDRAKPVFIALAQKYPDFAGPLANLGILAEQQGDMDAAIAQYQVALAIKPDHVAALNNLAILLQQRGEFERAAEFYLRGLKAAPTSPELNYNLAVLYELYLRDFNKAIRYYESYNASLDQPDAEVETLLKGLKRRVN